MHNKRKYIELFAGCGGLSLGLESSGWELEMANELSPMAAETFAYNLLGEVVGEPDYAVESNVIHTNSIKSIKTKDWNKKKLVVGDVVQLVEELKVRPQLLKRFKNIDMISGGPPCQGFSMAGKRTERDPKNKLPYALVDLVELVKPKTVILENVEGILRPFKSDGGTKLPWLEIAKAFAIIGYAPLCFLLNAREFGIPQNRPRFIMLGIHKSLKNIVIKKLESTEHNEIKKVFDHAFDFAEKDPLFITGYVGNDPAIHIDVINTKFAESRNIKTTQIFNSKNLFPEVNEHEMSVIEAIDDLSNTGGFKIKNEDGIILETPKSTKYPQFLSSKFSSHLNHPENHKSGLYNHELRKHSLKVTNRFIFLQEIKKIRENSIRVCLENCLKGKKVEEINLEKSRKKLIKNKRLKGFIDTSSNSRMQSSIDEIRSKKQTQRAISPQMPAPAQLTIPDDICHYSDKQPRTLSVREMARIQSFPDEFIFRSKVTTGGENRRYEVPQYTQVGNAVPPLLGRAIGIWVSKILE